MKTFVLKINEKDQETGVKLLSLVENPAMESDFIAYSEDVQYTLLASNEKRFLTGAILIPDKPILRIDGAGNPYKVVLSAKDIELIAKKFFKEGNQNHTNEEHSIELSNNTLFESWIKTSENDKSKDFGLEHAVGTWFGTMFIEDQKYWDEKIKTGIVKGFSIEGFFKQLELSSKLLNQVKNKSKMNKKNIFSKALDLLKQMFQEQFLEDGTAIEISDAGIVNYVNEDGSLGDILPAGDYKLQDGSTITVDESGAIVKEDAPTEASKEEPKAEDAPKEKLESAKFLTGESIDITDGMVTIDGQPAPDGVKFIVATDGTLSIAKIVAGKIESNIEILDAEKALSEMQMEAIDPEDVNQEAFASYKDILEKQKKRNSALKAKLKDAEEKIKTLEAEPAAEKIVTNEFSKVTTDKNESNPVLNYMKLMGK